MTEIINTSSDLGEDYSVSVAARIIYQLGEQLISDEFIALAELIKNGYDADCTNVDINIDTEVMTPHGQGRIVIQDNGNGMTKGILTESFLRISSDFKKNNRYSPFFKRRALGEKGLGRLSIQRLGTHLTLITSPRIERLKDLVTEEDKTINSQYNVNKLKIDWNAFKNETGDISLVKARISEEYQESPLFGTELIIEGIRNINFWKLDARTKTRIRTEVFGMTNLFEQKVAKKFRINMVVNNDNFTNEKIDEEILDQLCDVKLSFSMKNMIINMKLYQRKRYKDRIVDKTINNMKEHGFTEYHIKRHQNDSEESFQINLRDGLPFDKYPYLKNTILHKINVNDKSNKKYSDIADPGDFEGVLYVSDQSPNALTEGVSVLSKSEKGVKTHKELKAIWQAASGVYLFRNDFRIFPYGQSDFDWLRFTERSQKEKSNIFKMHTVSGYIDIDSVTSENVMEQTNRLGLIEDEYGTNFLTIVRDIITEIGFKLDVKLRDQLNVSNRELKDPNTKEIMTNDKSIIFIRTDEDLEEESTLNLIGKNIQKISSSPNIDNETKNTIISLQEGFGKLLKMDQQNKQRFKQEAKTYEQQIIDLQSLIGLAGQGIIVESLTHELHRIESNVKEYARESKNKIAVNKKTIGSIASDLIEYQDRILQEIIYLKQQLEHLEPTYSKNKILLENVKLKDLLQGLYLGNGPMAKKAQKTKTKVNILGNDFEFKANKGILITIFDNLFINSLHWVEENNTKDKNINFKLLPEQKSVIVWDSGPGFHEDIVSIMFDPYKSMKKDGRGLGLYIVSELVRMLHGSIIVEDNINDTGNKYILKISFK